MGEFILVAVSGAIAVGLGKLAFYWGGWWGIGSYLAIGLYLGYRYTPNGWGDVLGQPPAPIPATYVKCLKCGYKQVVDDPKDKYEIETKNIACVNCHDVFSYRTTPMHDFLSDR